LSLKEEYELAVAFKEMALYKDAITLLKKNLKKRKDKKYTPDLLDCYLLLSICYIENREYFEAITLLEKVLNQFEKKKDKEHKGYAIELVYQLSLAYEASGNVHKALYYLRKIEKEDRRYRNIEDRIKKIRNKIHA